MCHCKGVISFPRGDELQISWSPKVRGEHMAFSSIVVISMVESQKSKLKNSKISMKDS